MKINYKNWLQWIMHQHAVYIGSKEFMKKSKNSTLDLNSFLFLGTIFFKPTTYYLKKKIVCLKNFTILKLLSKYFAVYIFWQKKKWCNNTILLKSYYLVIRQSKISVWGAGYNVSRKKSYCFSKGLAFLHHLHYFYVVTRSVKNKCIYLMCDIHLSRSIFHCLFLYLTWWLLYRSIFQCDN